MSYTAEPENASDKSVTWSSTNESVATVKESTATPEPEITLGDVDADGDVDAADALLVLKYAAKIINEF